MYQVTEDHIDGLKRIRIINGDTGEYASVIPGFGANLNELVLKQNDRLVNAIDGNRAATGFEGPGIFNSAKLLPFPNRVADGSYEFEQKRYQLDINFHDENNACHGFIYYQLFQLSSKNEAKGYGEITLIYSYRHLYDGFPFDFDVEMVYRLQSEKGLRCQTKVTNMGLQKMPLGDGWHPFFSFGKNINSAELRFTTEKIIQVDTRMIPTGQSVAYNDFAKLTPIGETSFDTCFRIRNKKGIHTATLFDKETQTRINLWQETGPGKYNYLQIYIPPNRDQIALEPMSCNVNAFNNRDGLVVLAPGNVFQAAYGIHMEK